MRKRSAIAAAAFASLFGVSPAFATPRPLPFTYPYQTLPQGSLEVEQFIDVTPSRALSASTGSPTSLALFLFTTELEYGLTDRLELGLYMQLAPGVGDGYAGAGAIDASGAKQRLRYRFGREGELPVDVSVYGEITETQRELELEAKLNLQKRFGNLTVATNLWTEYEIYFDGRREWVLNPTIGATYQVTPSFYAGVESWVRAEFLETNPPKVRPFALGPHVFVGPSLMVNLGRMWWSVGTYFRVSDVARPVDVGDVFGRVWVRSAVGLDL